MKPAEVFRRHMLIMQAAAKRSCCLSDFADETGLHESAVRECVKTLEDMGMISLSSSKKKGRGIVYVANYEFRPVGKKKRK